MLVANLQIVTANCSSTSTGIRNLVTFLLKYGQTSAHKITKVDLDIRKFSVHRSSPNALLLAASQNTLVHDLTHTLRFTGL